MRNASGCSSRKGRMDPAGWDEHGKSVRQLKTNPLWPQSVTFPKGMAGHGGKHRTLMANTGVYLVLVQWMEAVW